MSVLISIFIVILMGLIIYFIKPNFFMMYCISVEPIVLPIIAWLLRIYNYDDLHEVKLKILGTGVGLLLIIILVIEFIRHKRISRISNVVIAFVILCCYLFFFYLIHNFDLQLYFADVRQGMVPLLVLCLLFMNAKFIPTLRQLNIYVFIFIFYELVWCVLNLKGIYIYTCQYIENTTYRTLDGSYVDLISGTFQRFSDLADFSTTIYLYICVLFFYEERIDAKRFLFLSVVIFGIVLMSGAKISFILMFFLLLYCCSVNWQKYKNLSLSLIFGSFVVLSLFLFYDLSTISIENPGLSRIVNQMSSIISSSDKSETGTLSLSFYLLDHYFWKNPILGTGLVSYNGAEAYGLSSFLKTDARIAYMLTEYGLLGFIIYLYYYFSIFKLLSKSKSIFLLCYSYFFLLTLTQPGFFGYIPIYIYIIFSVVIRNENIINNPHCYL